MNNIDEIYKSLLSEGYKVFEINGMHMRDIDRLNSIYEEKETTIDKAFPFLF